MTKDRPAAGSASQSSGRFYHFDPLSKLGLTVSARDAYKVAGHSHAEVQISIPYGNTRIEAQWQQADGTMRETAADSGAVIIVPPHQHHAVYWKNQANFVNLHLGIDPADRDLAAFLDSIAVAGEMHVCQDPFLYIFGQNVVSLLRRGVVIDSAMLSAFRLLMIEHITRTYGMVMSCEAAALPGFFMGGTLSDMIMPAGVEVEADETDIQETPLERPFSRASGLAPWQLRKVTAIVESDLRRDRSIAELAELVDLSKGHFSRAFRISTGLSPRQWIIHQRVKLAIRKLAHSSESLAEIAQSCGFSEQSHFTRTFTQVTGTSPGAWRRAHKI